MKPPEKKKIGAEIEKIYAPLNRIISSSRKGLNMVYLALSKETKKPCPNPSLKITKGIAGSRETTTSTESHSTGANSGGISRWRGAIGFHRRKQRERFIDPLCVQNEMGIVSIKRFWNSRTFFVEKLTRYFPIIFRKALTI